MDQAPDSISDNDQQSDGLINRNVYSICGNPGNAYSVGKKYQVLKQNQQLPTPVSLLQKGRGGKDYKGKNRKPQNV